MNGLPVLVQLSHSCCKRHWLASIRHHGSVHLTITDGDDSTLVRDDEDEITRYPTGINCL